MNASKRAASGGCRVAGVVTVDARGQLVLPKDVRDRAGFRAGERLAVVTWECDGAVCCVALVKTDALTAAVQSVLGPAIQGLTPSSRGRGRGR